MMEELQSAKRDLEKRVEERTSALAAVNEKLQIEIKENILVREKVKESFDEKIVLIKEIHHRVKNNLQVISSIMNLQSAYIKNKEINELFMISRNRIRTMALVYEKLYLSQNLNSINFRDYIYSLTVELSQLYNIDKNRILLSYEVDDINIKIDPAILCGLILNELVTNAFLHAFPGQKKGDIFIGFRKNGSIYNMIIRDNGIGLPAGFDWRQSDKLGLQLVISLIEQLHGISKISSVNSLEFDISFPA
jgi:two-component sensor histidine kinase